MNTAQLNTMSVVYRCGECRASFREWFSKCGNCGKPDTARVIERRPVKPLSPAPGSAGYKPGPVARLSDVPPENDSRVVTNIRGLDEILGGGLVRGAVTLICGEPGNGKSTLVFQAGVNAAELGFKTIYVSAEETAQRLSARARRLNLEKNRMLVCTYTETLAIRRALRIERPQLVIVDSLQMLHSDRIAARNGSPTQLIATAEMLVATATELRAAVLVVGHVTRDNTMSGPRTVEHKIDVMTYFDTDDEDGEIRQFYATKNRFGPTGVPHAFRMTARGLV